MSENYQDELMKGESGVIKTLCLRPSEFAGMFSASYHDSRWPSRKFEMIGDNADMCCMGIMVAVNGMKRMDEMGLSGR